jgi:hypothetical protein
MNLTPRRAAFRNSPWSDTSTRRRRCPSTQNNDCRFSTQFTPSRESETMNAMSKKPKQTTKSHPIAAEMPRKFQNLYEKLRATNDIDVHRDEVHDLATIYAYCDYDEYREILNAVYVMGDIQAVTRRWGRLRRDLGKTIRLPPSLSCGSTPWRQRTRRCPR